MHSLVSTIVANFTASQIYVIEYAKYRYPHCEYFVDTSITNIFNLYFKALVDFYSSDFDKNDHEEYRYLYFNDTIKESVLKCGYDFESRISCIKMFIDENPKNIKIMIPGDNGIIVDMDKCKILTLINEITHIRKKMDQNTIIANIITEYVKPRIYFIQSVEYQDEIFVSSSVNKVINYCFEIICNQFASDIETDKNEPGYKLSHCADIEYRKKLLRETIIDKNYFEDIYDFQYINSDYETINMNGEDLHELLK